MIGFLFFLWSNQLNISLTDVYYTYPIVVIARLLPFTLNGLGIQEAIMVVLLK